MGELAEKAGAPAERIQIVAPAIKASRFSPEGASLRERWDVDDRPVILTLARLVPRKGQDTVIRALPKVAEAIPDIVHVIAGAGPDHGRLRSLAAGPDRPRSRGASSHPTSRTVPIR